MSRIIMIMILFSLAFTLPALAETDEIAKADQLWADHKTQGLTEKTIAVLEPLVVKEPGNYEVLWRLSRCYQFLGSVSIRKERTIAFEKGLSYGEKALKADEKGVNGLVWHAVLLGCSLQEKRDLSSLKLVVQMEEELQTALKLDPQNGIAHFALAQLYYSAPGKPLSIGDKKKAYEEARLAVKYNSDHPGSWMFYGWMALQNNDNTIAKTAYAKYLDGIDDYRKYATLITRENQIELDYEALWRLGHFYQICGESCLNKQQKLAFFEKGLIFTERAIKLNSKGVEGHLYRAILIGNTGLEKGILNSLAMVRPMHDELKIALELDPENAMAHYMLAQLYWKVPIKPVSIGDKKKALAEAALAVKYDPKEIRYWLDYGKIAVDNKDYAIARNAFSKVLGFFGEYYYYKMEAVKELEKLPKK